MLNAVWTVKSTVPLSAGRIFFLSSFRIGMNTSVSGTPKANRHSLAFNHPSALSSAGKNKNLTSLGQYGTT